MHSWGLIWIRQEKATPSPTKEVLKQFYAQFEEQAAPIKSAYCAFAVSIWGVVRENGDLEVMSMPIKERYPLWIKGRMNFALRNKEGFDLHERAKTIRLSSSLYSSAWSNPPYARGAHLPSSEERSFYLVISSTSNLQKWHYHRLNYCSLVPVWHLNKSNWKFKLDVFRHPLLEMKTVI